MNSRRPSDPTLEYYARNAERYVSETVGVDMGALYREFLPLLPARGHILDAGCGSGRDTQHFLRQGFRVTAFDATPELAARATSLIGQEVLVMSFLDVAWQAAFDGIWACASLLHVPRVEMDAVLSRLSRALKPGGTMYASFKQGEAERVRGGRYFNDYQEPEFQRLLQRHPELTLTKLWLTTDVRPERSNERWLNALLSRG